jgi:RHS repeat-associated protein
MYISKDGFMETFVVNETSEDVWFDNMMVMSMSSPIAQETHYDPWGLELTGIGYQYGGIKANRYLYQGKEFLDDLSLNIYDFHARGYDPVIGRTWQLDPHAHKYPSMSPYSWVANNPLIYIDPDGRDIKIASEEVDGKTVITITVTGKLVNESGTSYTSEQLQAYTDRLVSSISSAYTGSDGDVSWKGVANITVATDDNPLSSTDHAFRIVDEGDIPGAEGVTGVLGMAPFGENVVYLSNHMLDRKQAAEGEYAGTGKTATGTGTLERTGPHELGHSGNLRHPAPGTLDGNLMHQTRQPNAGMKLTKDQIHEMKKAYNDGKLNKGKQK